MAYELIETVEFPTTEAYSFTDIQNIPQDGKDLVIIFSVRYNQAAAARSAQVRFNNISTSTYDHLYVAFEGTSSIGTSGGVLTSSIWPVIVNDTRTFSNTFSNSQITISNYANSTRKAAFSEAISEDDATLQMLRLTTYRHADTNPITSLQIGMAPVAGSSFSLYKIS